MEQDNGPLFRELDEIVGGGLADDLGIEADMILEEQTLHRYERELFDRAARKLPYLQVVIRNFYTEGGETLVNLDEVIQAIDMTMDTNRLERTEQLLLMNVRTTVWLIMFMASRQLADTEDETKKQVQAEVLDAKYLMADQKKVFVEIADQIFEGGGIDTSDPDQVVAALSDLRQRDIEEKKRTIRNARCGQLFDEVFGAYAALQIDPTFHTLRGLTILHIATMRQPKAVMSKELILDLRLFGIPPETYATLYEQLWTKYNEACEF